MGQAAQPAPTGNPLAFHYERRHPEETTLYQVVQEQLETFLARVEAQTGSSLPEFIEDEFDAFLECGILAHGLLRMRCTDCAHEKLVAFSCKRRGFCHSCGARRMAETAVCGQACKSRGVADRPAAAFRNPGSDAPARAPGSEHGDDGGERHYAARGTLDKLGRDRHQADGLQPEIITLTDNTVNFGHKETLTISAERV